jgi:hypothetical protein
MTTGPDVLANLVITKGSPKMAAVTRVHNMDQQQGSTTIRTDREGSQ